MNYGIEQTWQGFKDKAQKVGAPAKDFIDITKFALALIADTVDIIRKEITQTKKDMVDLNNETKKEMEQELLFHVREMKNRKEQEIRDLKKQENNSKQPVEDFKDYNNLPYEGMQKDEESEEEEEESDEEAKK
jgi:hypothetical protein